MGSSILISLRETHNISRITILNMNKFIVAVALFGAVMGDGGSHHAPAAHDSGYAAPADAYASPAAEYAAPSAYEAPTASLFSSPSLLPSSSPSSSLLSSGLCSVPRSLCSEEFSTPWASSSLTLSTPSSTPLDSPSLAAMAPLEEFAPPSTPSLWEDHSATSASLT